MIIQASWPHSHTVRDLLWLWPSNQNPIQMLSDVLCSQWLRCSLIEFYSRTFFWEGGLWRLKTKSFPAYQDVHMVNSSARKWFLPFQLVWFDSSSQEAWRLKTLEYFKRTWEKSGMMWIYKVDLSCFSILHISTDSELRLTTTGFTDVSQDTDVLLIL